MIAAGRVGGPELLVDEEPFAAGDVVVVRQNDPRLGLANGDRGIITGVIGGALRAEVGGRQVVLSAEFLARRTAHGDPVLAHGYAVTGHIAQGLTADRAFVLGSDLMYREWAYTAMSRGRVMNRLFMVGTTDRARDEIAPATRLSAEEELAGALRRSRAQLMAVDTGTTPEQPSSERGRDLAAERARLERRLGELAEPSRRRRLWRRRADRSAGGARALVENRLAELRIEETELARAPTSPRLENPSRAVERAPERRALER
jgi:hypothetical protein